MPPLAAAASSSRCGPFACRRGADHQREQAPAAANSGQGCGRPLVGRAAGLVGGGIAAVFFASLERCACVEVRTTDDLADYAEAAAPLMQRDDAAAARNVYTARQSKRTTARAGSGKGRRGGGGFGCCENSHN
ncbi:hypothetical protein ACQ4PT_016597 [Festuca glaucescens]